MPCYDTAKDTSHLADNQIPICLPLHSQVTPLPPGRQKQTRTRYFTRPHSHTDRRCEQAKKRCPCHQSPGGHTLPLAPLPALGSDSGASGASCRLHVGSGQNENGRGSYVTWSGSLVHWSCCVIWCPRPGPSQRALTGTLGMCRESPHREAAPRTCAGTSPWRCRASSLLADKAGTGKQKVLAVATQTATRLALLPRHQLKCRPRLGRQQRRVWGWPEEWHEWLKIQAV